MERRHDRGRHPAPDAGPEPQDSPTPRRSVVLSLADHRHGSGKASLNAPPVPEPWADQATWQRFWRELADWAPGYRASWGRSA
jgi:hypothetical protein